MLEKINLFGIYLFQVENTKASGFLCHKIYMRTLSLKYIDYLLNYFLLYYCVCMCACVFVALGINCLIFNKTTNWNSLIMHDFSKNNS